MEVFYKYGSKERLIEMMQRVNKLNESILSKEEKNEVIDKFVDFVKNRIGLGDNTPNISISYDDDAAKEMKSFGGYTPNNNTIIVIAANRNLADILRTLAHELIHSKQNKEGRLMPDSGETGSEIENEANALAGVILREFGRNNNIIYE